MAANRTSGANELLTGQIASMLTALTNIVSAKVFSGPSLSQDDT